MYTVAFVKYTLDLEVWLLKLRPHFKANLRETSRGKLGVKSVNQPLGSILHPRGGHLSAF